MITKYKDFNNILKNYNNTTFKLKSQRLNKITNKVDIGRRINKNNFYRAVQVDSKQLLVSVRTEDNNKLDIIKIQTI